MAVSLCIACYACNAFLKQYFVFYAYYQMHPCEKWVADNSETIMVRQCLDLLLHILAEGTQETEVRWQLNLPQFFMYLGVAQCLVGHISFLHSIAV